MTALAVNQDERVGRMLSGLIASTNRKARVDLTVTVRRPDRVTEMHQTFRLRKWVADRDGTPFLFIDLPDTGDWEAGIRPLTAARLNLSTGEYVENPRRDDRMTRLLGYGATAALQYARTGRTPTPPNGTVEILEHDFCGACGQPLSDPESLRAGIGPECERRITGKRRTKRSRRMPTGDTPTPEGSPR